MTLNYHCEFLINKKGISIRLFIGYFYWLFIPWEMIISVKELPPEIQFGLGTYGFPISVIRIKQLPIFWRINNSILKLFAPLGPGLSFPIHPALEHHDELVRLIAERTNLERSSGIVGQGG